MSLTDHALKNSTAVIVAILLIMMFGLLSLNRLPVQLTPNITQPQISIATTWRPAAPNEVESEIIEPQEHALKSLQGVEKITSSAVQDGATITLTYKPGINLDRALMDVMNALNQVPSYPLDAKEPVISTGGNSVFDAIAWLGLMPLDGNDNDIIGYQDYIEDVIKPHLERIPGVSRANIFGGLPREIRITFDPYKIASLGLELTQITNKLYNNNDVSAGFKDVSRRRYTVRYAGKYQVERLGELVIDWRDNKAIRLQDIATITTELADSYGELSLDAEIGVAINVQPESGVNVIDVDRALKRVLVELNQGPLKHERLKLVQLYDQTVYINQSMTMVKTNLALGCVLAIVVLWWFLRKFKATLAVAMSIPISLLLTFIALDATGRSLNIISMAGLAFAVGMVLDAAIVVLENIVRMRQQGQSVHQAAASGAKQIWPALLASTITTVVIFLPIVFLTDVSGQLFADLAIAIAVAVSASLIVAVTLLPAIAKRMIEDLDASDPHEQIWHNISSLIMRLTSSNARRISWVSGLFIAAISIGYIAFPLTDYLPRGNQNGFQAFIIPPTGLSIKAGHREYTEVINQRLAPYIKEGKDPQIAHSWMGMFGSFAFIGGTAVNADEIGDVIDVLNRDVISGFPDTDSIAMQEELFSTLDGGRVIALDLHGVDEQTLLAAASYGKALIEEVLSHSYVDPKPGLAVSEPELRLIPNDRAIAQAGLDRQQLGQVIRAYNSGLYVGEYFNGQRRHNIYVRSANWKTPEQLGDLPLYTPLAGAVPLKSLVTMARTTGPTEIRRIDGKRTITLEITPPDDISIEQTIAILKQQVGPLIAEKLNSSGEVKYSGSAQALKIAIENMSQSFLLALIILFLIMAALFQSFKDSLIVMITIPLATVGGVVALQITDLLTGFQPLDLLTMIGFVILLGLVVNNAILLVHQTRQAQAQGCNREQAVHQAIRLRLRPILMSTLTSIFGMLPLLLLPGAGTELYRGIAAVIVGGMSVSTLFTLVFLPSLLQLLPAPAISGLSSQQSGVDEQTCTLIK